MRIAIINQYRNVRGGVETYLSQLLAGLQRQGYEIAFWHVDQMMPDYPQIAIPPRTPVWSVDELGERAALNALADWRPDVIFAHGLRSPDLERKTQKIAPAVFFAHAYYGACISGGKTFHRPDVKACERSFGWQCFLQYYPRRCGGLNPITMVKEYQRQADRLALLADYGAIVVASEHMADEYRKYGLSGKVSLVGLPISPAEAARPAARAQSPNREWRLLFLGRMETLKGGEVFLEALPQAQAELGKSLRVTFAGDGPKREAWQQRAAQLSVEHPGLKFDFPGWVTAEQRGELFQNCDLIVVPSLWPEPFGLVGLEAGQYGVPAVAFAVGGVVSWLHDGVNGRLANSEPPSEPSLTRAIVDCLKDENVHQRLMSGAVEQARRFGLSEHFEKLLPVLEGAAKSQAHVLSFNAELVQSQ